MLLGVGGVFAVVIVVTTVICTNGMRYGCCARQRLPNARYIVDIDAAKEVRKCKISECIKHDRNGSAGNAALPFADCMKCCSMCCGIPLLCQRLEWDASLLR